MQQIKLSDREITVSELLVEDAGEADVVFLKSVEKILQAYAQWDQPLFQLSLAQPNLFYKLLARATGLKKKQLKAMKARDFDTLVFVFLSVNAELFIQRLKLMQRAA